MSNYRLEMEYTSAGSALNGYIAIFTGGVTLRSFKFIDDDTNTVIFETPDFSTPHIESDGSESATTHGLYFSNYAVTKVPTDNPGGLYKNITSISMADRVTINGNEYPYILTEEEYESQQEILEGHYYGPIYANYNDGGRLYPGASISHTYVPSGVGTGSTCYDHFIVLDPEDVCIWGRDAGGFYVQGSRLQGKPSFEIFGDLNYAYYGSYNNGSGGIRSTSYNFSLGQFHVVFSDTGVSAEFTKYDCPRTRDDDSSTGTTYEFTVEYENANGYTANNPYLLTGYQYHAYTLNNNPNSSVSAVYFGYSDATETPGLFNGYYNSGSAQHPRTYYNGDIVLGNDTGDGYRFYRCVYEPADPNADPCYTTTSNTNLTTSSLSNPSWDGYGKWASVSFDEVMRIARETGASVPSGVLRVGANTVDTCTYNAPVIYTLSDDPFDATDVEIYSTYDSTEHKLYIRCSNFFNTINPTSIELDASIVAYGSQTPQCGDTGAGIFRPDAVRTGTNAYGAVYWEFEFDDIGTAGHIQTDALYDVYAWATGEDCFTSEPTIMHMGQLEKTYVPAQIDVTHTYLVDKIPGASTTVFNNTLISGYSDAWTAWTSNSGSHTLYNALCCARSGDTIVFATTLLGNGQTQPPVVSDQESLCAFYGITIDASVPYKVSGGNVVEDTDAASWYGVAINADNYGFYVCSDDDNGVTIRNISINGGDIGIQADSPCIIDGCTIDSCLRYGICSHSASVVSRCKITNCGTIIQVDGESYALGAGAVLLGVSRVSTCLFVGSSHAIYNRPTCVIYNCTIIGNETAPNSSAIRRFCSTANTFVDGYSMTNTLNSGTALSRSHNNILIVTDQATELEDLAVFDKYDSGHGNTIVPADDNVTYLDYLDEVTYAPLANSDVIDQGDTVVFEATDLAGNPRVSGSGIDIGCYEYQQSVIGNLTVTALNNAYDGSDQDVILYTPNNADDVIMYQIAAFDGYDTNNPYETAIGSYYQSSFIRYNDDQGWPYIPTIKNVGDSWSTTPVFVTSSNSGYWMGDIAPAITPKQLSISAQNPTTVAGKRYDGTTDAEITRGTVVGVIPGDDVTVVASGEFESAEIGDYDVVVSYTLSGNDAANYAAPSSDTVQASIITAVLPDISDVTLENWSGAYDGLPHSVTFSDPSANSDTIIYTYNGTESSVIPTFTNVGTYTVGVRINRDGYNEWTGSAGVTISPATITGVTVTDTIHSYDSNAYGVGLSGTEPGDTVLYSTNGTNYSANQPTYVNVGSYTVYVKVQRPNYNDWTGSANVVISNATLTGVAVTGVTVIYDGEDHTITVSGTEAGDIVLYSVDGDSYTSQVPKFSDAGTYDIRVKVQRTNYDEWVGNATLTINQRQLTVSGTVAENKQYDGTTTATFSENGMLGNVIGNDRVIVVANGAFPSSELGTWSIDVSYTIGGAASENYIAPVAGTVSAAIDQRQIRATNVIVNDKSYDGTTTASLGVITYRDILEEDEGYVEVDAVGSFASASVGQDKPVTITYTLSGGVLGDHSSYYQAPETDYTHTADIIATVIENVGIQGYTGTYDGVPHSVEVTVPDAETDTVTYSTDSGDDKVYTDTVPLFTDAGTYVVYVKVSREGSNDWLGSGTVKISKKQLTATGSPVIVARGYDGTNIVQINTDNIALNNVIPGDIVILTASGVMPTSGPGLEQVVITYKLEGDSAGNYLAPSGLKRTGTVTIAPSMKTVSFIAVGYKAGN